MQQDDAWLSSIMPAGLSAAQSHHSCGTLELHKRLVHLATLREAALKRLGHLDGVKVSLTERKATQQGRLLAALDARLATAHAAVEPHRCAAWDLVKALEKEAAFYSDILKGLQQSPPAEQWAALTERYQHLQQQVQQQQEQAVKPPDLEQTLSASLQPCQPEHVQLVEQLRSQVDSLTQQLQQQQAHLAQQHLQETEQQEVHCVQELAAMQQLAALVLQQLQVYHSMQSGERQQQQLGSDWVTPPLQPGGHHHHLRQQQQQQQQQQHALACSGEGAAGRKAAQAQHLAGASSCSSLLAHCHTLKHQLQQVSEAADMLVQLAPCSSKPAADAAAFSPVQLGLLSNELQDPLDRCSFGSSAHPAAGLAADQLWQEMHGLTASQSFQQPMLQQQQQQLRGMSVRLHPALHQHSSGCGGDGSSTMPLQVVKLRLAYQQMLHKVQARYQHNLRQQEVKQQEALQAQSHSQQLAMADMVKQHQEVCGRLAAAATAEADLQQQLARLVGDKQALQQQVDKLQWEVGGAAASALAVVQVQHEQQLLAAKQEQQQALQDAKQQLESLQKQLQDLQQQAVHQASAVPLAETVAALVADATAKQSAQQQEQLQQLEATYQAALQQREHQHISLLHDLAELRQLQEEASALSSSSAATDVTAAAMPATAATAATAPTAAPVAASASAPGYPSASYPSAALQPLGSWASGAVGEGASPGENTCSASASGGSTQHPEAPLESGQAGMGPLHHVNVDFPAQHLSAGASGSSSVSVRAHSSTADAAAAASASSAGEQQRILQMLDSSVSISQTAQQPTGDSQHTEYHQQQQHAGGFHHQQHTGSYQHQQQHEGEFHEHQQRHAEGCNSHHHQQQQQQQHFEPESRDNDAMGALIAAVLGPGPIGRAQQQLHKQRMAAAQQEQQQQQRHSSTVEHRRQPDAVYVQQEHQHQQQQKRGLRHQPVQPLELQEELDKLLGLSGSPSTLSGRYNTGSSGSKPAAADRRVQETLAVNSSKPHHSRAAALAPANAEMAAAMARAKVAETCLPALQDISCSSTCNKAAEGPHQPGIRGPQNSNTGEVVGVANRPPWKPASPGKVASPQKQQQRQQQWQQWQQLPKGSSGGSGMVGSGGSPSRAGSRTPSPIRQQQQQRAAGQQQQQELPVLQCVRCGQQEGAGPDGSGPCCFHPGLVPAPGPLMYGPEWHACRARCTPDMPGCYTRRDHFFSPLLDCPNKSQPGPPSSTGATTQSEPPARSSSSSAAAGGGGCSPQTAAARQTNRAAGAGGIRSSGSSPRLAGTLQGSSQQQYIASSRDRPAPSPNRAISRSGGDSRDKVCGVGVSPPWAVATGRYVGAGAVGAGGQQGPPTDSNRAGGMVGLCEPEPRSSLPKPSVWRG